MREALQRKVSQENGLRDREVMVTAGGNQAFLNVVMTLLDPGDEVVLFQPYYFNHLMTLQLAGAKVRLAGCGPDLSPDIEALDLTERTKMVILVNPANPTGAVCSKADLELLMSKCREAEAWLVSDEAYENFVFDGAKHHSPDGDQVINLYSLSKAYGMAGYRLGYFAYPPDLELELLKVQDTAVVCAAHLSQLMGLAALEQAGSNWVAEKVGSLNANRKVVYKAVKACGTSRTKGAFYFLVPLTKGSDDWAVVRKLAQKHQVLVAPGQPFGAPGHLRVSYGNLPVEECNEAAERLAKGLDALIS